MDVATLRRLSALLDEALDLDQAGRTAWVAGLKGKDAELVPMLGDLLAHHATHASADFLDRGPDLTALASEGGPNSAQFNSGGSVGPYRLLRELGVGGMGEVWLAERADGSLKRTVALKLPVLSVRRTVLVQRFERERDILASLVHPHIARLYDAGFSQDGQPYLALEYVQGEPVTDYADGRGLDTRKRVQVLRQVMDAVQYAHANLIIHRDLKPSNVMVGEDGKALLLDFGIAKLLEEDTSHAQESELTRAGGSALTLPYASPEQVAGQPISISTDIWSLGVLLYELLTGQRPFEGKDRRSLEHAVLTSDPPRPSQRGSGSISRSPKGMAADLDTIVLKALRKTPSVSAPIEY